MSERSPGDFVSIVPRYTFASGLGEQEKQLADNPMLRRFRESRRRLSADRHRPAYHYVNPEGTLNDPNGLCFWKGRWHLFYQGYPPEDPRQHWGHAVSEDLIHWRDLPYAIYPDPEECCYSGTTFVEEDRVIAIYHGTKAGTMVAVSTDPLLLNWEKVTGKPVIPLPKPGEPAPPYNVFDPCIWKRDDVYYALTAGTLPEGPGGKNIRALFLHRSTDLARWEYLHPFLEDDDYGLVGDDGACPYFWPIGDRHMLLHFSHMSGGKYLVGDYDTDRDKLVVTSGGDFNFGPVHPAGVHAPSATPDGKGGIIVIFNMNPGIPGAPNGWNQIMSLPRRLTLLDDQTEYGKRFAPIGLEAPKVPSGMHDRIAIEPAGDIESARGEHVRLESLELPANEDVSMGEVEGDTLEIQAEIDPGDASVVEMDVLRSPGGEEVTRILFMKNRGYRISDYGRGPYRSVICLDTSRSSILPDVLCRIPETADVEIAEGEPVRLRVFLDRSIVEVFVNERQCVAARVYPGRADSIGVTMRAQGAGARLLSLDAWKMKSVY